MTQLRSKDLSTASAAESKTLVMSIYLSLRLNGSTSHRPLSTNINVNILIAILAPIFVARLPLCAVAIDIDPALSFDGIIG